MSAEAPLCLSPLPVAGELSPPLPAESVDCHFHVFDTATPFASPRSYTPSREGTTLSGWQALADAAGIARGVAVQPSVYGTDNGVLLAALKAMPGRLRGVVVTPADTPEETLATMHEAGVRAIRVNLTNKGGLGVDAIPALVRRIAPYGWHLQFQIAPENTDLVADAVRDHGISAVIDHAGFMKVSDDALRREGTAALRRLLDTGKVYVKLSAPYRLAAAPDYPGFGALVAALAASHPERLLWGSDWPHTELFEQVPEDFSLMTAMREWLGSEALCRRVFADNPKALYWRDEQ